MKNKILFLIIFIGFLSVCTGCLPIRGLKSDVIVKHPDAPMLILEFKKHGVKVAIYDAQENKMIEYPDLIPLDHYLAGWTFTKYDWQKFMKSKEDN